MGRRLSGVLSWLLVSTLGCAGPSAEVLERASPQAEESTLARAEQAPPETPAEPPLARLELGEQGWARAGAQGSGPLLRLEHYDSYGPVGEALESDLLERLEPIHACFEALLGERPDADMELSYRVRLGDGIEDGVEIDARPPAPQGTQLCLRRGLASAGQGLAAEERAGLVVRLRFFPRAQEVPPLRVPSPEDQTSTRIGGTCWTWEDYPCAPHKRCMADVWVRPARRPELEAAM